MRGRFQPQEIQFFKWQRNKELDAVMNLLRYLKKDVPGLRVISLKLAGLRELQCATIGCPGQSGVFSWPHRKA